MPPRALVPGGAPYVDEPPAKACTSSTESPAHTIRTHRAQRAHLAARRLREPQGRAGGRAERYQRLEPWARERVGVDRCSAGRPRTRCRPTACPNRPGRPRLEATSGWPPASASGGWRSASPRRSCWRLGSTAATTPGATLFDTRPAAAAGTGAVSLLKENANVALRFFGDLRRQARRRRLDRAGAGPHRGAPESRSGLCYRDEKVTARPVGALPPPRLHRRLELGRADLGLPVHGSRFGTRGEVTGPAPSAAWSGATCPVSAWAQPLDAALLLRELPLVLAQVSACLALLELGLCGSSA